MKKIALCFYGLIRSFEKIYKLMLSNYNISEGDEVHVFITTSNYDNVKYRFRKVRDKIINIDSLKNNITNLVGSDLKYLNNQLILR